MICPHSLETEFIGDSELRSELQGLPNSLWKTRSMELTFGIFFCTPVPRNARIVLCEHCNTLQHSAT